MTDYFIQALKLLMSFDAELLDIIALSLQVSFTAVILAFFIGAPLGALIAMSKFKGRTAVVAFINTCLALPPVFIGLVIYLLLSKTGYLGFLDWLFTPKAMILAQFMLCLPIVMALTLKTLEPLWLTFGEHLRVDGAGVRACIRTLFEIALSQLVTVFLTAFGRAIAEVGAIMMVGGNIRGSTRTMTTTIALETSKGDFALAISLGLVLLLIALIINMAITYYFEKQKTII